MTASTDTITITAGRPGREGTEKDFAGPDGTYPVALVSVSDVIEEVSRQPRTNANGKPDPRDDGKWVYRIWTVAIEDGEYENQVLDLRANARSTGPKSKQYGIIAAFLGRVPAVGEAVNLKDLAGRSALASILTNDSDYPYIDKLMAAPRSAAPAGRGFAAAAMAPEPAPSGQEVPALPF